MSNATHRHLCLIITNLPSLAQPYKMKSPTLFRDCLLLEFVVTNLRYIPIGEKLIVLRALPLKNLVTWSPI